MNTRKNRLNILKWRILDQYEKWRSISPKYRRIILGVSLVTLFLLFFGIRALILHRYDSTQKLEAFYSANKTLFHSTAEALTSLPVHPDLPAGTEQGAAIKLEGTYDGSTIIKLDEAWDPIDSYDVCQKQGELWICSATAYTEKEYQMIYDAVMPILQQTRINTIVLSYDRHFVDFKVCGNSSCLDCVFYHDGFRTLDLADYLEHYYVSYHYRCAHMDSSVAKDIKPIDEFWYASTAGYYF